MADGDLKVSREERKKTRRGKKMKQAGVMNTKRHRGRKEDEQGGKKVILKDVKDAVLSEVR